MYAAIRWIVPVLLIAGGSARATEGDDPSYYFVDQPVVADVGPVAAKDVSPHDPAHYLDYAPATATEGSGGAEPAAMACCQGCPHAHRG